MFWPLRVSLVTEVEMSCLLAPNDARKAVALDDSASSEHIVRAGLRQRNTPSLYISIDSLEGARPCRCIFSHIARVSRPDSCHNLIRLHACFGSEAYEFVPPHPGLGNPGAIEPFGSSFITRYAVWHLMSVDWLLIVVLPHRP